jgi:acetyl esterase
MCRAFFAGHPAGVTAEMAAIDARDRRIPVRTYRRDVPDDTALVLYLHGGGFSLGGLESQDDVCAELCGRTGFEVISVDYRLAPEHLHPAAFDDALAAFRWAAARDGRPIVLCGDSAGGNLAAAVAHATRRDARRPAGQVLIYPTLGGEHRSGSYVTHAEAPMLTLAEVEFSRDLRTGGRPPARDASFAPLADSDFANLPPTIVISAQCDPLCSDGETYRDRIAAAGGRAFWLEERGLVHGYLRARHTVKRARESFGRIVAAVAALGRGEWPSDAGAAPSPTEP